MNKHIFQSYVLNKYGHLIEITSISTISENLAKKEETIERKEGKTCPYRDGLFCNTHCALAAYNTLSGIFRLCNGNLLQITEDNREFKDKDGDIKK